MKYIEMCIGGWKIYGERNETETEEERGRQRKVGEGEKGDRQIHLSVKKEFPYIFTFHVHEKPLKVVISHFKSKEIVVQIN